MLVEINGIEKTRRLLDAPSEQLARIENRPHDEIATPPPEGIHPAYPDADDPMTAADVTLDPSHAGLMAAFGMPVADE
jgi:hypothetical protein